MAGGGTDGHVYNGKMESKAVQAPYRIRDRSTIRMQYVTTGAASTSKTDGRSNNNNTIRLNLAMEVGSSGLDTFNGWNMTGCAYDASCRQTDEEYEANKQRLLRNDFDWKFPNIMAAFDPFFNNGTVFAKQFLENIDYAFYNRGIWGPVQLNKTQSIMASLRRITKGRRQPGRQTKNNSNEPRCFYKSTTASNSGHEAKNEVWESGPIRNATRNAGCEYFDVHHLTKDFLKPPWREHSNQAFIDGTSAFTDLVHFQPWVYEELNNMLLNVLCNSVQ